MLLREVRALHITKPDSLESPLQPPPTTSSPDAAPLELKLTTPSALPLVFAGMPKSSG